VIQPPLDIEKGLAQGLSKRYLVFSKARKKNEKRKEKVKEGEK
jgi:hypothetical protein